MADWDKGSPADSDLLSQFPANERTARGAVETNFGIDHHEADDADIGKHEIVQLLVQATPAAVAGQGNFYTRDTGAGAVELFHQDEAGNETQITSRGAVVPAGSIDTAKLADAAVTAVKIATDAVTSAKIATDAVTAAKIATDAVTAAKIAAGAVDTSEIAAGAVGQSEVANSAIGQGELKSATANTGTGLLNNGAGTNLVLTGGGWSHWAIADATARFMYVTASTSATNFSIRVENQTGSVDQSATLHEQYHTASPPYDLGDGVVGAFVSAIILPDGSIDAVSIAPDPVWANNGPTNIRPDRVDKKTGRKYRRVRRPAVTLADVDAGTADLADYIAAQAEAVVEEVEITMAYKNADMGLIPHSWASPPQGTICLLDPVNTHDLLMLHEAGEDVADLIHRGYITVGNEALNRKGPPGVMPVSWKWRNTRP